MTDSPFRENALGNPGGWTEERLRKIPMYKEQIVELVRSGLFLSEISQQLEIMPKTIRGWRKQDVEFDQAYSDAEDSYIDSVEKEAVRRAKYGVLEPVISQGRVVMDPSNPGQPLYIRKYSDPLMMFILKGRRRDVYGDKREVEQTNKFDFTGAKDELARRIAALVEPKGEA